MAARSPEDDFGDRLRAVKERGDLTIGDLYQWFERPRPTVRYWVKQGYGIYHLGDGERKRLYWLLSMLERVVDLAEISGEKLVSPDISLRNRPAYIKRIRDEYARLSAADPAG